MIKPFALIVFRVIRLIQQQKKIVLNIRRKSIVYKTILRLFFRFLNLFQLKIELITK
jgi:hypothetical protein